MLNVTMSRQVKNEILLENVHTFLVLCRPFLPNKDTDTLPINYYFVNPNFIDSLSILTVTNNYSHIFVEKVLVPLLKDVTNKIRSKVIEIDNITVDDRIEVDDVRIAFLVSSDTHANFMVKIAKRFKNVLFLIPARHCKNEGAAEILGEHGYVSVEIDYLATESKELDKFMPDLVFCAADWTSEFLAVQRALKDKGVPIIALQEGPQDWHMKFWQNIKGRRVLKNQNHYRNADIFFSQGAVTLNYIRPQYFAVTGNLKISKIERIPLPPNPKVLINCNFTYIKTKPPYENNRDMWMQGVLRVCKRLNLPYIISKHPRDDSTWDDSNLVVSNAAKIEDQLISCSIVISRFSSILYEALALCRAAVYYNPHCEPMLTFTEDVHGIPHLATTEEELTEIEIEVEAAAI